MKKTIIALSIALASLSATAGEYQNQVARRTFCDDIGGIAESAFSDRGLANGRWNKEYYFKLYKDQMAYNQRADEIFRYAITYGAEQATDKKDAHMQAWAFCMDKTR